MMSDIDQNKQIIQNFIQMVWNGRDLSASKDFWAEDCVNHAMPGTNNRGLNALRIYHDAFFDDFFLLSPTSRLRSCSRLRKAIRLRIHHEPRHT